MQFLESVGLLAIFSSFPRRASHLSMKHNLNVECEIPPMVGLYSNEKHEILNQKMPKIDTLDALDDEITSILNTL